MTTLGALLAGLVLLLLLLGVLVWMQRRARRGPEQPRTVADLVRMREAARPAADDTEVDAPSAGSDRASDPVDAPQSPVVAAEVAEPAPAPEPVDERPEDRKAIRTPVTVSPEDAAVEAPWARAARMVEPWRGLSASDEVQPVAEAARADVAPAGTAPAGAPRRPSLALVPSGDADARFARRPRAESAPRLSKPAIPDSATAQRAASSQARSIGVATRPDPPTPSAAPVVGAERPAAAAPAGAAQAAPSGVAEAAPVAAPTAPAGVAGAAPVAAPTVAAEPAPDVAPTEPAGVADAAPAAAPTAAPGAAAADAAPAPGASAADAATARASIAPTVASTAPAAAPITMSDAPAAGSRAPSAPAVDTERPAAFDRAPAERAGVADVAGEPTPTPARVAGRVRRRPSATPAEQAAADLALLRTFGVAHRNGADEPDVALEGCTPDDDAPAAGNAQPISFRVLGRDGRGIRGATVTLLDDHGRETANTRTDAEGHGVLTARHPGGYMLVTAADGFQPGAVTVAVTDEPVDAEIPLTRSASIAGSVGGEDGPIVGAQLALVQDGEIVDTAVSSADGGFWFADLAAGEYGLSVTAHECEPAAFVVELVDEAVLRQDVELVPAGLPSDDVINA